MILYHGTIMPVPSPLAHIGREELDFGKGFYLTKIKEQAEAWARKKMFIEHASRAVLNVYEFDSEAAIGSGISYLSMPQYDKEWLDFVVGNRKGHNHWRAYKVIEGLYDRSYYCRASTWAVTFCQTQSSDLYT